jgi:hypothetical protein
MNKDAHEPHLVFFVFIVSFINKWASRIVPAPAHQSGIVQHVRGVAGQIYSVTHVDKPCRFRPNFRVGGVG